MLRASLVCPEHSVLSIPVRSIDTTVMREKARNTLASQQVCSQCDATSLIGVRTGCMRGETHLSLLRLSGAVQAQVCVGVQVQEGLQHIQHLGHLGEDEGLVPACLQLVQQLCQLLQPALQVRPALAVTYADSNCEANSCAHPEALASVWRCEPCAGHFFCWSSSCASTQRLLCKYMPAVQLHTGISPPGTAAMYKQRRGDLSGLGYASLLVLQLQSSSLLSHVRPKHILAVERVQFWLMDQACLLSIGAQCHSTCC